MKVHEMNSGEKNNSSSAYHACQWGNRTGLRCMAGASILMELLQKPEIKIRKLFFEGASMYTNAYIEK